MNDGGRAIRQLEILFQSLDWNCHRNTSERKCIYPLSTVYYWPEREEIEVVPYKGERDAK